MPDFCGVFLNGKGRHFSYAPGSGAVQPPFASEKISGISLKFFGESNASTLFWPFQETPQMKNFIYRVSSQLCLALCLGALVLVQNSLHAAEPIDAEIKALIEQLASPNKAPKTIADNDGGPEADYTQNYDHAAQKKVWAAYSQLMKIGPQAFPLLHTARKDKRYALTEDAGDYERNFTVGFLCDWILRQQISPFAEYVVGKGYTEGHHVYDNVVVGPRGERPSRPNYFDHVKSNEKWFLKNQTSSLRYIQIEALQWMIAEEEKEKKIFDAEEIAALKGILNELELNHSRIISGRTFFAK